MTSSPTPPTPRHSQTFERDLKTAEVVARKIVSDISAKEVKPNEPLDNESAMLRRYGVSRGTLREALRILESQGVLTLKSGPGGGPVVAQPEAEAFGRVLAMQIHGFTYAELAEAFITLEPLLAEAAAHRVVADGVAGHGGADPGEDSAQSEFHHWVHWKANSEVLSLLAGAVGSVMSHHLRLHVDIDRLTFESDTDHHEIREQIRAGDASGARASMTAHVERIFAQARQDCRDFFESVVSWL
jgi:GntR family transcriptional regulator, transcriptional repressor for pyruvate dehydrogenase complex